MPTTSTLVDQLTSAGVDAALVEQVRTLQIEHLMFRRMLVALPRKKQHRLFSIAAAWSDEPMASIARGWLQTLERMES